VAKATTRTAIPAAAMGSVRVRRNRATVMQRN
jgi:hypothetical protein